jgi:hypothetical protein
MRAVIMKMTYMWRELHMTLMILLMTKRKEKAPVMTSPKRYETKLSKRGKRKKRAQGSEPNGLVSAPHHAEALDSKEESSDRDCFT